MAQDVTKPLNSGRLSLPPVDGAMNKISPAMTAGGRGAKPRDTASEEERERKFLGRVVKRMDRAISAESDNRKKALDDIKMLNGDQWPAEIIAQRNLDKRPCHTINKLPTFIHQITNDLRQNRPSININPVGDRGDPEVAKMFRGLVRAIERDSVADIAYDTGVHNAVANGFGYWRVLTDWESPESFNQVPVIRRIRNPFTVYMDPTHIEPDGSDCEWVFVSEMMTRAEFEDTYPDADPMPFVQAGIGETMKNWVTPDEIRIAEYFEVKHETRTLVALDNGHVGWEDELSEVVLSEIERGNLKIIDERESRETKIKWYKLTAKEILKEEDWPGKWIPIVKIIGDEVDVEGRVTYSGVIRNSKDAQKSYNYWTTKLTEAIALSPNAPWVLEEGQVEGHEDEWRMANVQNNPYLSYKATSVAGRPAPPPQRQPFAQVPSGILSALQQSAQDMQATTGIRFDATMNERMIDESGKAIRELRKTGDLGAFHYADNMARSLRHTGAILIDLIMKLYDDARVVTILREDDTEETVKIDPHASAPFHEMKNPTTGKTLKVFNPKFGRYGVTVTIGPSYATKRIEASENMIAFARALPNTAAVIADLIAKNQDWPGAQEIAARLAKTLPPNLLAPDQKDMTPQVQALLQSMDMQIKQLTQQLQQAMFALNDKNADRALESSKIQHDYEAKLLKIVSDAETKMAATEEKATSNFATHIRAIAENATQLAHLTEKSTSKEV